MNLFLILLIIIVLVVGGIALISVLAPSVTEFHKDSLAPVRGLVGNPESAAKLAAFI